jgi:uncharacterized protein YbjT (DUF2867 family)
VLGATGGIGRWVVRDALASGWSVRALVRSPVAAEPGVEVRVGDPLRAADVAVALEGVDSVVIALGLPWLVRAVMRASKVRFSYADHDAQERVLEASGLPVLMLRPTILTNEESLACAEVTDPKALPLTAKVSRRAVARFAVDVLRTTRTGVVTLSGSAK